MFALFFQVALGGAIGAVARYMIGLLVIFPFGTMAVNVVGSFLMGVAWVMMTERGLERWMPGVLTGLLGGFTTFSAFSLDTFRLVDDGRILAAGGYVLATVLLSVLALFVAIALTRFAQV